MAWAKTGEYGADVRAAETLELPDGVVVKPGGLYSLETDPPAWRVEFGIAPFSGYVPGDNWPAALTPEVQAEIVERAFNAVTADFAADLAGAPPLLPQRAAPKWLERESKGDPEIYQMLERRELGYG